MKLILLFFSIVLNFSLIKEASSNNNDKLMLVGFQYFNDSVSDKNISFIIYFKKYNNNFSSRYAEIELILFNNTSEYYNETKTNCSNPNEQDDEIYYFCNFYSPDASEVQVKLKNTNFKFYNESDYEIYPPDIIESSLAKKVKNDISSQVNPLNYYTFYFDNFTQNDDIVQINGGMVPNVINRKTYTLNLTNKTYDCTVYNSNISFNLNNNNINENLIGKMLFNPSGDPQILIFSNDPSKNDLLMYSNVKSSSADLYGFENYSHPNGENAKNVAVFFGTPNILKKYLRFRAKIIYRSNGSNSALRFLGETEANATGEIDPDSTNIDNGQANYIMEYEGTKNISNILSIESLGEYQTGDSLNSLSPILVFIVGNYINLTNSGLLPKPVFIYFKDKPIIDGNSFSLKFELQSKSTTLNITNKHPAYLDYTSMETSQRDIIDSCTIGNNTNIFTINCEPKKDIYTLLNSLIIRVPNITTSRKLRFLQSSGNSTIHFPKTTSGDIQFEYNPEINTFGRKSSKKKGLSGGAIAAIVLATIAAVAAVGVAIFFLNRGPINPIKTSTEMNLPNSTTNINN